MTESDSLDHGEPLNLTDVERESLGHLEGAPGDPSEWVTGEGQPAAREHSGEPGLLPEIDASAYLDGSTALPPAEPDVEAVFSAAQAASTPAEKKAAHRLAYQAIHESIRMDSDTRLRLLNLEAELRQQLAEVTA